MSNITHLKAREILDSRSIPALEVDLALESGITARASIPSGASTGSKEALELRDNDQSRFRGQGLMKAISNIINELSTAVVGLESSDQQVIDEAMIAADGTPNKNRFGANSMLAVSIAAAKASAAELGIEACEYIAGNCEMTIPVPCMNMINGGLHAFGQGCDFQEFMIIPAGADSFRESLMWGSEIYMSLKSILVENGLSAGVGDEGGFIPLLSSNQKALDFLMAAIETAGFTPGENIWLACDSAANTFYKDGLYHLRTEDKCLTSQEMVKYYLKLVKNYPLVSWEDPLSEFDWANWPEMTELLSPHVEIVGDDIFVTNPETIKAGIDDKVATSSIIKLNQIGTITETREAIKTTLEGGWTTFLSHRSGETNDDFLADFAVGTNSFRLKSGAPCRGERLAKYNRLLRIEEQLLGEAVFAGKKAFHKIE